MTMISDKSKVIFTKKPNNIGNISVSVVIPVLNGELTLGEQLAALADQDTNIEFEVVISDNGSTDRTRIVSMQFADKFGAMKIVDSSDIRGVSNARNVGVLNAQGRKILFCDADDRVSPMWLEAMTRGLDEHTMVGGASRVGVLSNGRYAKENIKITKELNSIFGFLPYALGGAMGVDREACVTIGGFDSSYIRGHEEADFSWRMQLAGYTLGFCSDAVVDYRQRNNIKNMLKQTYHYAQSSILLWVRFSPKHDLSSVSFKGSVRALFCQLITIPNILVPSRREMQVRGLGWSAGIVSGHLKYRIRRNIPTRITINL